MLLILQLHRTVPLFSEVNATQVWSTSAWGFRCSPLCKISVVSSFNQLIKHIGYNKELDWLQAGYIHVYVCGYSMCSMQLDIAVCIIYDDTWLSYSLKMIETPSQTVFSSKLMWNLNSAWSKTPKSSVFLYISVVFTELIGIYLFYCMNPTKRHCTSI